eukprot:gene11487-biopygen9163
MGILKTRTTAYHPQCDGLVERQNRTIQDMLSAFVSKYRDDWDLWVDLVVYAYNTSVHSATGFSPYEMVFGCEARTPLDSDLGVPLKNPGSQHEVVRSIRSRLSSIKQAAQTRLDQGRRRQENKNSFSNHWSPFSVGQSVWLSRPKAWKFGTRWIGPYKIISRFGVNYRLQSKEGGGDVVIHHNNIKICTVPCDKGVPYCPVKETGEITLVRGDGVPNGEDMGNLAQNGDHQHIGRPARLRQHINVPLRFGEYVTH